MKRKIMGFHDVGNEDDTCYINEIKNLSWPHSCIGACWWVQ